MQWAMSQRSGCVASPKILALTGRWSFAQLADELPPVGHFDQSVAPTRLTFDRQSLYDSSEIS